MSRAGLGHSLSAMTMGLHHLLDFQTEVNPCDMTPALPAASAAAPAPNGTANPLPTTGQPVPEGFKPRHLGDGFVAINGPFYTRRTPGNPQGMQMGFRVEHRHTNPMGICHGGMMATFCDMLLPMTAHLLAKETAGRFLPTINLNIDYLAPSPLGAWVQGEAQVLKVTRSMVFMQGLVTADGVAVARVNGLMKIGPTFNFVRPDKAAA